MSAFVVGVSALQRAPGRTRAAARSRTVVAMSAKPLKVSTDMKGKPVWTLREATESDAKQIADLQDVIPESLVRGVIGNSEGSALVAQVTVKGGQAETAAAALARPDESSSGDDESGMPSSNTIVVGAVLPYLTKVPAVPSQDPNTELKKSGDLIMLKVDERMPDHEDVAKKLLLGSLKKLKTGGIYEFYATTKKGSALKEVLETTGFTASTENQEEETETMFANLMSLNPDPQKKMN